MTAVITGAVIVAAGAITAGVVAADASARAATKMASSGDRAIAEQRSQFETFQQSLAPYSQGGESAFQRQQALLGMNGEQAQQQAIDRIEGGARFQSMVQQGENAMLQNASATGGLRGGNIQAALAQYRPQVLNQLIDKQYSDLGNMAQLGQASAAGVGAAGMQSASNIGGMMMAQGDAQAQAILQQGQAIGNTINAGATALGAGVGAMNSGSGGQNISAIGQSAQGLNADLGQPSGMTSNQMVDSLFD